jgi:hypothetical protein
VSDFDIGMLSVFMLNVAMAVCLGAKTAHPEVKGSNLAAPWYQEKQLRKTKKKQFCLHNLSLEALIY